LGFLSPSLARTGAGLGVSATIRAKRAGQEGARTAVKAVFGSSIEVQGGVDEDTVLVASKRTFALTEADIVLDVAAACASILAEERRLATIEDEKEDSDVSST